MTPASGSLFLLCIGLLSGVNGIDFKKDYVDYRDWLHPSRNFETQYNRKIMNSAASSQATNASLSSGEGIITPSPNITSSLNPESSPSQAIDDTTSLSPGASSQSTEISSASSIDASTQSINASSSSAPVATDPSPSPSTDTTAQSSDASSTPAPVTSPSDATNPSPSPSTDTTTQSSDASSTSYPVTSPSEGTDASPSSKPDVSSSVSEISSDSTTPTDISSATEHSTIIDASSSSVDVKSSTAFETSSVSTTADPRKDTNPSPSNKTWSLKLGIAITFLVIAVVAATVLIGYTIKVKRRRIEYDELVLLP